MLYISESNDSYAMFLPPDMKSVREFREELQRSLKKHGFEGTDILQIELAADEALTNSVSANANCNCEETIICRWKIHDMKLVLFILDYGSGFKQNIADQDNTDTKRDLKKFISDVKEHQQGKDDLVWFNGVKIHHKNSGQGLKIINSLMDSVKILYHTDNSVTDNPNVSNIKGSILEISYDAKKQTK